MRILFAIYLPRLSIRLSHLAVCHQAAPSGLASLMLFVSFLMPLSLFRGFAQWVTPPSFAITLMPCVSPKLRIQDPAQQSSRASFLPSLSQVASNGEYPRATSIQPASLVEESNRYQGAVLRCVQRAMHLGLVTEVPRIQCFMKRSHVLHTSTILGWFCFVCLPRL